MSESKTGESAWPAVPEGHLGIATLGEGPEATLVPDLQAAALAAMGQPACFRHFETKVEDLGECLKRLAEAGYKGVNVGSPFKPAAARLAQHFYVVKHSLGTANALNLEGGIWAQNSEVTAFKKTIEGLEPGAALVLGSGHAARSASMALLDSGWKVRVWSRSALKARPMMTLLQRYGSIELASTADPASCTLIVNATPMGLRPGELPPINMNHARRGTTVVDLVVRRVSTELIRAANLRGLKTVDGRELVIEQAAQVLEWWTGAPVPREAMRAVAWKRD